MIGVERIGDSVWVCGVECTIDQAKKVRRELMSVLKKPKEPKLFPEDSYPIRLARKYFQIIRARNKEIKEPDYQQWAKHIDLMIRVDNRQPKEIYEKMMAVQNDAFWRDNLLGPAKLRLRWNEGKLNRLNQNTDTDDLSVRYG